VDQEEDQGGSVDQEEDRADPVVELAVRDRVWDASLLFAGTVGCAGVCAAG
jgi:hypothetical protein